MKNGYRLHIEGRSEEPIAFRNMKEVRKEQKSLAREYGRTIKEIDAMSYIMTEETFSGLEKE